MPWLPGIRPPSDCFCEGYRIGTPFKNCPWTYKAVSGRCFPLQKLAVATLHNVTMPTMQDNIFSQHVPTIDTLDVSSPLTSQVFVVLDPSWCRSETLKAYQRKARQTRTARHIVPQDTTRNDQKGSTYINNYQHISNYQIDKLQVRL